MKRILILMLTVAMLISALCVPSFAVISELSYVHANSYMLPEMTISDCTHDWDGNTCMLCGTTCEHDMDLNYYSNNFNYYECLYCMYCGYSEPPYLTVPHTYLDGVCSTCGHECTHGSFDENGDCIFCTLKECTEHSFIGTVCDNCGYVCTHSSVEEGEEGTCPDCGYYVAPSECTHELFDAQTGLCELCGALVSEPNDGPVDQPTVPDEGCTIHSFAEGVCAICGYVCEHQSYTSGICNDCGFQFPTDSDSPTPSNPSPSAPSVSDDNELSFGGFVSILGGAAAIFGIIYAISVLKEKIR